MWDIWYTWVTSDLVGGCMKIVNLRKARDKYSQIIHEVAYLHERYTICKVSKPMVVMVSYDDWQIIEQMFRDIDAKRQLKE
jgi:prevent-host-death family protein